MNARSWLSRPAGRTIAWICFTVLLTVFFASTSAVDLDNFRPVSNDDGWIMSASYKLAYQGIFGSDMWAGFFHAERSYFIALPVHHVLQALTFRVAGAGIAQSRYASVLAAVVLLWTVGWLAYRWYGLAAGLLAEGLLALWASNLTASWPGLPLLTLSRSGRYDLDAVALMWLAVCSLDWLLRTRSPLAAVLAGACSALAALTQFFGAFALPVVLAVWLQAQGRRALRDRLAGWLLAGAVIIAGPYGVYVWQHYQDAVGQTVALKGERAGFATVDFYLGNLSREPGRYAHLAQWPALAGPYQPSRPASAWLLVLGLLPALRRLWQRLRRGTSAGDRILAATLAGFASQLAVLDESKATLYAIVLLPSLCILLAMWLADLLSWLWRARPEWPARLAVGLLLAGGGARLVVDSARAFQIDGAQVGQVTPYAVAGRRIDAYLAPGAAAAGPERWWWALREHPYLAMDNLRLQWTLAGGTAPGLSRFADLVERNGVAYIVASDPAPGAVPNNMSELDQVYARFLQTCTDRVAAWSDATYGNIAVYRVRRQPLAAALCTAMPVTVPPGPRNTDCLSTSLRPVTAARSACKLFGARTATGLPARSLSWAYPLRSARRAPCR